MTVTIVKSGDYWLVQFGQHEIVSIHTDEDEAIAAGQKLLGQRRDMSHESAARALAVQDGQDWSAMGDLDREFYRIEARIIEEVAQ